MIKISGETAKKRLNMWFRVSITSSTFISSVFQIAELIKKKAQVLLLSCSSLNLTNSPPSILHFKQEQCMLMLSPFEACFTPGESFPQDPLIFLYLCHYCLTGLCVQSFFALIQTMLHQISILTSQRIVCSVRMSLLVYLSPKDLRIPTGRPNPISHLLIPIKPIPSESNDISVLPSRGDSYRES